MMHFWNNLQVRSKPKYLKAKSFLNLWEQENQRAKTKYPIKIETKTCHYLKVRNVGMSKVF
jgi:hypothetical protein